MVNFEEHFWGDKYNGFEVLQQNFKLGLNTGKEFAEFLKERSSIEETYSKSLLKLANKCASANQHVGTFEPCWKFLQSSTEKLANVHNQIIQNLNDVSKSVRDYGELQKEKQKQMKDDFVSTTEAVLNLQNLSAALIKARELYQQRSQEVEKCRKDLTNLKDIKNAELKYKKSTDDYKQLVDKRETARKDYCVKITEISQKLQTVEEEHLTSMLDILSKYGESLKTERFLLDQIIDEFGRNMIALTVENLLQQFINQKMTGKGRPLPLDFEESQLQSKPVDLDAIAQQLKEEKKKRKAEKREKKAERKKKKEKAAAAANGTVEEGAEETQESQNEVMVDDEGFVIRPPDTDSLNSGKLSKDSCSSDSDSEDSDAERQRIKVRIKPVEETKGSNSNLSQEELKKLSAALTLMSPSTVHQKMSQLEDKKFSYGWGSDSTLNKQAFKSKSNIDLLNLDQNSDTASIHSLPVNSSFPGLHSNEEIGMPNKPFDESSTSSPITSPPNGSNLSGGSGSLSPSTSFDKSVKSLESIEKSSTDELNSIDVPPPLPVKSRTLPPRSLPNYNTSLDEMDLKGNPTLDITSHPMSITDNEKGTKTEDNPGLDSTRLPNDVQDEVPNKVAVAVPEKILPPPSVSNTNTEKVLPSTTAPTVVSDKILLPSTALTTIQDKTLVPSTTTTITVSDKILLPSIAPTNTIPNKILPPSAGKTFPSLEALKPPPLEKRTSNSFVGSTRALPSNIPTAVPRPKPGQLTSVNPRNANGPSMSATLPAGMNSQSFFSDLLDINFSSTLSSSAGNNSSTAATNSSTSSTNSLTPSTSSTSSLTASSSSLPISSTTIAANTSTFTSSTSSVSTSSLKSDDSPWIDPEKNSDVTLVTSSNQGKTVEVNTMSAWVKPDKNPESNAVSSFKQELISDQDSSPPIIPRRSTMSTSAPANSTSPCLVSPIPVDRAIPIAVAFMETVNGVFRGCEDKSCVVKVTGDMTISFPANIISVLSNNPQPPPLTFLVSGTTSLEQIFPNKQLVERGGQLPGGEGMLFKFNMVALAAYLKKQAEQATKASYYNIDILKYQVRCYGLSSAPLQLSSYWRCDPDQTDLKIDYTYNSSCMSSPVALNNVSVVVPVDGGVEIMQSKPTAIWSSEHQRCMWKLASISTNNDSSGTNALRARFDITRGPTNPVPIAIQFTGEGSTISSLNFDLKSSAYKLSLVKKRFTSGKYAVESS